MGNETLKHAESFRKGTVVEVRLRCLLRCLKVYLCLIDTSHQLDIETPSVLSREHYLIAQFNEF